MAPPFRWFDAFQDAGWPDKLSRSAMQLVWAIGRRVDRMRHTRISLPRLQAEARLPRRTFFDAKRELLRYGVVQRIRVRGQRTATLVLALPVPEVPSPALASAGFRTSKCGALHPRVQVAAPPNGQKPPRDRKTAGKRQKTRAQLGGKSEEQSALTDFLKSQGVPSAFVVAFAAAVRSIVAFPAGDVRSAAVNDAAFSLSRQLQSRNVLWPEAKVCSLLTDTVAIVNGATQEATS